jgi:hypothetical protein
MCEAEHPDTIRLRKLASLMQKNWGRKDRAGYVFPQYGSTLESDREECLLDDLRTYIDNDLEKPEGQDDWV